MLPSFPSVRVFTPFPALPLLILIGQQLVRMTLISQQDNRKEIRTSKVMLKPFYHSWKFLQNDPESSRLPDSKQLLSTGMLQHKPADDLLLHLSADKHNGSTTYSPTWSNSITISRKTNSEHLLF